MAFYKQELLDRNVLPRISTWFSGALFNKGFLDPVGSEKVLKFVICSLQETMQCQGPAFLNGPQTRDFRMSYVHIKS